MTMHNLAGNTDFWARSNFNSFANFGSLMTNSSALESWHQKERLFLSIYQGAGASIKNNYVLRANRQYVYLGKYQGHLGIYFLRGSSTVRRLLLDLSMQLVKILCKMIGCFQKNAHPPKLAIWLRQRVQSWILSHIFNTSVSSMVAWTSIMQGRETVSPWISKNTSPFLCREVNTVAVSSAPGWPWCHEL